MKIYKDIQTSLKKSKIEQRLYRKKLLKIFYNIIEMISIIYLKIKLKSLKNT